MAYTLAIDTGATTTRLGLYDDQGGLVAQHQAGPANAAHLGADGCVSVLAAAGHLLIDEYGPVRVVAAGVSGARQQHVRQAIAQGLAAEFQAERALVADDRSALLLANTRGDPGVVVIAGTGSSVAARSRAGQWAMAGGHGPVFGDDGSGYGVAVAGLRAAADGWDGVGPETVLSEQLAKAAGCAGFGAVAQWSTRAGKDQIARLAHVVLACADEGDDVARGCVDEQARHLAALTMAVFTRLVLAYDTPIYLHGGLLTRGARFRTCYEQVLHEHNPQAKTTFAAIDGHQAVLELTRLQSAAERVAVWSGPQQEAVSLPPTERRFEGERTLDQCSATEIVEMMNRADNQALLAVARAAADIAQAIEMAADALRADGRIIYCGAGTSGRLGVLDASECPPTFGVGPERVIGLLAGGTQALSGSVEDAEDDTGRAVADLDAMAPPVTANDVLIGIAASGHTPYVRAMLDTARERGVPTILIACNPVSPTAARQVVTLLTGPEVLTGSTRLKAGTATKLVLNMVSTGAMALAGYIYRGLMVGMRPVNTKLRRRAIGIVTSILGCGEQRAQDLLYESEYDIREAVVMGARGVDRTEAQTLLDQARGDLREIL